MAGEKEVKKIKPKTVISFVSIGKKAMFTSMSRDLKGDIVKVHEKDQKAIEELKKFVNSL